MQYRRSLLQTGGGERDGSVFGILYSSKEEWGRQGNPELKMVKQAHPKEEIQDGNPSIHSSNHSKRRFPGIPGSLRRLSACTDHRRFLRFAYNREHFEYRALPFGLKSSPRVFTKVLVTLVAHLRLQGTMPFPYLDNILGEEALWITIDCLHKHGFIVNIDKELFVPQTIHSTFGSANRDHTGYGFHSRQEDPKGPQPTPGNRAGSSFRADGPSETAGHDGIVSGCYPMVTLPHAATTKISEILSEGNSTQKSSRSHSPENGITVVADAQMVPTGRSPQGTSQSDNDNRCHSDRLWGGAYTGQKMAQGT